MAPDSPREEMAAIVRSLRGDGFASALRRSGGCSHSLGADVGADRVELYTEPFARAYERGDAAGRASFEAYARAAQLAASLGLGVNAGTTWTSRTSSYSQLPHLEEVSIGHALVSRALFVGLDRASATTWMRWR
jgi:pyridoxine 5-phosphate synthase